MEIKGRYLELSACEIDKLREEEWIKAAVDELNSYEIYCIEAESRLASNPTSTLNTLKLLHR